MKQLKNLLLGLLCIAIVASLSMEERRKRSTTNAKKENKQENKNKKKGVSTKRNAKKAPRIVSIGSKSITSDQGQFFKMVPQMMVRTQSVRFITLYLIKTQWQDCNTLFDPKLCRTDCARDVPIGDCPKCDETNQDPACLAIKEEKRCQEFTYFQSFTTNKEDKACCKYTMYANMCERENNPKQLAACCKEPEYKKDARCSCDTVIFNQKAYTEREIFDCCQQIEQQIGYVHHMCKSNCVIPEQKCCMMVFDNPTQNVENYYACCAQFPDNKQCKCLDITRDTTQIAMYPPQKVTQCCDEIYEKSQIIPPACIDQKCPYTTIFDSACCDSYMTSNRNKEFTQMCCKVEPYSTWPFCCGTLIDDCSVEPYKSSEFCICQQQIKIDTEFSETNRKCWCIIKPKDERCKNNQCKNYFEKGDFTDRFTNQACCQSPHAPDNFVSTYCKCDSNTDISKLDYERKTICCFQHKFYQQDANREPCCEFIRSHITISGYEQEKKDCCKSVCTSQCQQYGYCEPDPPICKTKIDKGCCVDTYNANKIQYQDNYMECCKQGFLKCPCDEAFTNIQEYGANHDHIIKCCHDHPPIYPISKNCKCDHGVQDRMSCCERIIENGYTQFDNFKKCCAVDQYKTKFKHICSSECSSSIYKEDCCKPFHIPNYRSNFYNYYKCCETEKFKKRNDSSFVMSKECECEYITTEKDKYFQTYHEGYYNYCISPEILCKEKDQKVCDCQKLKDQPLKYLQQGCCSIYQYSELCTCQNVLKHLPGISQTDIAKQCCHELPYRDQEQCTNSYGCDTHPFQNKCCKQFHENQQAYVQKYSTSSDESLKQSYSYFVDYCCNNYFPENIVKPNVCPVTNCQVTPKHPTCCESYTQPNDYTQDCCRQPHFKDTHHVCRCDIIAIPPNIPACKHKCTGEDPNIDYNDKNKEQCCKESFNAEHCCGSYYWGDLSVHQKQQCCARNYNSANCCSVTYKKEYCCKDNFDASCCKQDQNDKTYIGDEQYKLECCTNGNHLLNSKRTKILCDFCVRNPHICKPPDIIIPCNSGCPMTKEQQILEDCHCPSPPDIIICKPGEPGCPDPPICDCKEKKYILDPRCNCPQVCPKCPNPHKKQWCYCPDDCKNPPCDITPPRCPEKYKGTYPSCMPYPRVCIYPYKYDWCIHIIKCEGPQCCYDEFKHDNHKLMKCLCEKTQMYSPHFCLCLQRPDHESCKCNFNILPIPHPQPGCCAQPDLCKCWKVYAKIGKPVYENQVALELLPEWKVCCEKFFDRYFCKRTPEPPIINTCTTIIENNQVTDPKYIACCSRVWFSAQGKEELMVRSDYTNCCHEIYQKQGQKWYESHCKRHQEDCKQIIKVKRHKDKIDCCRQAEFRNYQECNVCAQNCVYNARKNGSYHPKFQQCCNKDFNMQKCCANYKTDIHHPMREKCCKHDATCCNNKDWRNPTYPQHKLCCSINQVDCCPLTVRIDKKHPDHDMCCTWFECHTVDDCPIEYYEKGNANYYRCCQQQPIPNKCCDDCEKILKQMEQDPSKFPLGTPEYKKCCFTPQIQPKECPPNERCVGICNNFFKYHDHAIWKECECPDDPCWRSETYICPYLDHMYYTRCSCIPHYVQPHCTFLVINNRLHPYWGFCCSKMGMPEPYCTQHHIDCIDEPCDERYMPEGGQEMFSNQGVLNSKRMRKKRFFRHKAHHDL